MVLSLREWSLTLGGQADNPILEAKDWTNSLPVERIIGGIEMITYGDGRLYPAFQQFQGGEEAMASVSVTEWCPGEDIVRPEAMIPRMASRSLVWDDTRMDARDYALVYALEAMQPYVERGVGDVSAKPAVKEERTASPADAGDVESSFSPVNENPNSRVAPLETDGSGEKATKSVTLTTYSFFGTHWILRKSTSWTDAGTSISSHYTSSGGGNPTSATIGSYLALLGTSDWGSLYYIQACSGDRSHLRADYLNRDPQWRSVDGRPYALGYYNGSLNIYEGVLYLNNAYWMGDISNTLQKP